MSLVENLGENVVENLGENVGENVVENLGENVGENLGENLVENVIENLGENLIENLGENKDKKKHKESKSSKASKYSKNIKYSNPLPIDKELIAEINMELNEYEILIRFKQSQFFKSLYCKALTTANNQCCHFTNNTNEIFCTLHKKRKFKPKHIIVDIKYSIMKDIKSYHPRFIDEKDNIITYPYKSKQNYFADIDLYISELKDKKYESLVKFKSINTCKVCCENYKHNDLIKCSSATCDNEHLTCKNCMKGYISSQITSNIGTYECMFNKSDKCNGEYSIPIIDTIFEKFNVGMAESDEKKPEIKAQWIELVNITNLYKMANICDDYIICPLCRKWGCIFEPNPLAYNNIYINCHHCKLKWCNTCKREEHGNDSCYKLNFKEGETEEKRISIIDFMIQDIISKALTHKCSTCGCAYIKEEGCNLMVCAHCSGMTCYLCNTKLYYKEGKGKYWHFAGHEFSDHDAICTIWNNIANDGQENQGNTNYNKKKICKEIILFMSNNNIELRKSIFGRIKFLYEKDNEFNFIITFMESLNIDEINILPRLD